MTDCNHLWRYSGSKRQQAWQCGHCQAWRFSEPVMREGKDFTISKPWASLTEEEINEVLGGDIRDEPSGMLEFVRAIEAKLREKSAIKEDKDFTISKPWVGLTVEEIHGASDSVDSCDDWHVCFAHAIESILKEKNASFG